MTIFSGMRGRPLTTVWLLVVVLLASVAVGWLTATGAFLLVLGGLAVLGLFLVGARNPRALFYLLVALMPLEVLLVVPGMPTSLLVVIGALVIAILLLQSLVRGTTLVIDHRVVVLAGAMALAIVFSAWAIGGPDTLGQTRPYWLVFILLFLTPNLLREERDLVNLSWVLTISLGILGAWVFFEQIWAFLQARGLLSATELHTRDLSVGMAPGETALRITKGIPFALALAIAYARSLRSRLLLSLCTLAMIAGTLATLSINALVGLAATLGLATLWIRNRSVRIVLLLLGFLVLVAVVMSPYIERFEEQRAVIIEGDPAQWGSYRGLLWQTSIEMIAQSPLVGYGPGVTTEEAQAVATSTLARRRLGDVTRFLPHNIFLSIMVELGLFGLVPFLLLLAVVILPLWRATREWWGGRGDERMLYLGQAILIGLLALLAQGMAISEHLNKYLWLLLGMTIAYMWVFRHTRAETHVDVGDQSPRVG